MDITGSGDAERVFATVINAIKIFVDKVKPKFIVFSAKEPSRQSLYKALANRVGRQIGYKLYPLNYERAMAIFGNESMANVLASNSADGSMLLLKREFR
jgi:4'-phosphopantetheinyl transferase EntD